MTLDNLPTVIRFIPKKAVVMARSVCACELSRMVEHCEQTIKRDFQNGAFKKKRTRMLSTFENDKSPKQVFITMERGHCDAFLVQSLHRKWKIHVPTQTFETPSDAVVCRHKIDNETKRADNETQAFLGLKCFPAPHHIQLILAAIAELVRAP